MELKDVIHLYLGCDVICRTAMLNNSIQPLRKEKLDEELLWKVHKGYEIIEKLLLKSLSDITEEEINELWKVFEFNTDYENEAYPNMSKKKYITEYFTRDPIWPRNYERFDFKQNCILIIYLLSKHFDLGLIEAGLAEDIKNVK